MRWVPTYSRLLIWRGVYLGILTAWFVKFPVLVFLFNSHVRIPVQSHPFFGSWWLDGYWPILLYVLPIVGILALFYPRKIWMQGASLLLVTSSLGLLWHIHAYNDATFVVVFWVSLWLFWWSGVVDTESQVQAICGVRLALAVVSLMFLGGAVGKWTESYWNGEAVYEIYFLRKQLPTYVFLREQLDPSSLRALATWFSRSIILMETVLATLLIWPARYAMTLGIPAMILMIAGSTLMLYSVIGALIWLVLAAYLVEQFELRAA
ncbi:MAG: hypothetical protein AAF558_15425 [Verrucomicrobiota bacterium]